jgi:hypothetical protein
MAWLTDLVLAVRADYRGTYGWRRVHAELIYGHGIIVNRKTIGKIMRACSCTACQALRNYSSPKPTLPPQPISSNECSTGRRPTSCGSPT